MGAVTPRLRRILVIWLTCTGLLARMMASGLTSLALAAILLAIGVTSVSPRPQLSLMRVHLMPSCRQARCRAPSASPG